MDMMNKLLVIRVNYKKVVTLTTINSSLFCQAIKILF